MKLQLDTVEKTIKVEQDVKFSILIEALEKMFPQGEWKEFVLETNTPIVHWTYPTVIQKEYVPYRENWWEKTPWICMNAIENDYSKANGNIYSLNEGKYNVEIK